MARTKAKKQNGLGGSSERRPARATPGPERGPSPAHRHVFIAGAPQSGTTALALLLNHHPGAAIGVGRFENLGGRLDPFHFDPEVFCHPIQRETAVVVPELYHLLERKFEAGDVTVVGDIVKHATLGDLGAAFPGCHVVFTVRDLDTIAASITQRDGDPENHPSVSAHHVAAAAAWNEALRAAREFDEAGHEDQLLIVPSEDLFNGQRLWLQMLLDFLELPPTRSVAREYDAAVASARARGQGGEHSLSAADRKLLSEHQDDTVERWLKDRIERQTRGFRARLRATDQTPPEELNDATPPVPSNLREQLLDALTAGPKDAEPTMDLENRVAAQLLEVTERGRRIINLEQTVGTTAQERDALQTQLDAAVAKREQLVGELQTAARAQEQLRQEMGQVVEERDRIAGELAEVVADRGQVRVRLRTELQKVETRRKELEAHVQGLVRERDDLQSQLASALRSQDDLQAGLAAAQQAGAAASEAHEQRRQELAAELETGVAERDQLRRELEERILEHQRLQAELEVGLTEQGRLQAQLQLGNGERDELKRRVAMRGEELDVAARNLVALEAATGSLERMLAELRDELGELRAENSDLSARVQALTRHADGLTKVLGEREAADVNRRAEIDALEQKLGRSRKEIAEAEEALSLREVRILELEDGIQALNFRQAELEEELHVRDTRLRELQSDLDGRGEELAQAERDLANRDVHVEELQRERERIRALVGDAARSRAWRFGHGMARLGRTITFRRSKRRQGALEVLLAQLDVSGSLPAPEEDGGEVANHG